MHILTVLNLTNIFLIIRAYFKFLVHILIVYQKSSSSVNIFHESVNNNINLLICHK